jgi:UDP-N-acetyl-2-amino-2-deoxyglucuronate dehydrogenase
VNTPLRVGLVGCGEVSAAHFDAILANPDATLVAIADTDEAQCAATAERYSASGYAEYAQMLSSEQLDLVHICTPHHLHADMAITCLEQSINVLVEKPPATTIAAAQQMIDVAKRSQAQLGVCFQNRYNHTSQALHDTLQSHRLGDVRGAVAYVTWFRNSNYYRTKEWRGRWATAGGGVLINQAIHTLDLLLWFLGEVQDVRGSASTLLLNDVIEVEDSVSLVLTHAGGIRSVIFATNNYVYDAPITIEIHTESATARLNTELTVTYADGRYETIARAPRLTGEKAHWGSSHGRLIDDFYRHVREGQPFWIDATEAMRALSVISSVYAQSTAPPRVRQECGVSDALPAKLFGLAWDCPTNGVSGLTRRAGARREGWRV